MFILFITVNVLPTKDELVWKSDWGGGIFFFHGSNHQKGVCILINPVYE